MQELFVSTFIVVVTVIISFASPEKLSCSTTESLDAFGGSKFSLKSFSKPVSKLDNKIPEPRGKCIQSSLHIHRVLVNYSKLFWSIIKGDNDILSMFLKQVFKKSAAEKKPYCLVGDLNINCLEYFENEKVSTFYNSLFEYGTIALINKPTRVAKTSATIIDNVITTNIFDESLKKGIIKSDLSDHLPIFFSISTLNCRKTLLHSNLKNVFLTKVT